MSLTFDLTLEHMQSYINAGIALHDELYRLHEHYPNLLLPSRGVFPLLNVGEDYRRLCNTQEKFFNKTILPFTSIGEQQDMMRTYWAKVYVGMQSSQENIELRVYKEFLKFANIPHTPLISTIITSKGPASFQESYTMADYLNKPFSNGKTVFIDTVISGRASTTILDALPTHTYAILIIDELGARLQEPYRTKLKQREREGRATLIPVKRLYTEDQGPIFLGSNAYVFNDVIDAINSDAELSSYGISGAGIWQLIPTIHKQAIATLDEVLTDWHYSALLLRFMHDSLIRESVGIPTYFDFEETIKKFIQKVDELSLLDKQHIPSLYPLTHVTSSYVGVVNSNPYAVKKFVQHLKKQIHTQFD